MQKHEAKLYFRFGIVQKFYYFCKSCFYFPQPDLTALLRNGSDFYKAADFPLFNLFAKKKSACRKIRPGIYRPAVRRGYDNFSHKNYKIFLLFLKPAQNFRQTLLHSLLCIKNSALAAPDRFLIPENTKSFLIISNCLS